MTSSTPHGSKPTPPDQRPYRSPSEPGPEVIHEVKGPAGQRWRTTWRQVGWHGQSGALYALGEPASEHEPGSYSPLYVVAHVDEIETAPGQTTDQRPADVELYASLIAAIARFDALITERTIRAMSAEEVGAAADVQQALKRMRERGVIPA